MAPEPSMNDTYTGGAIVPAGVQEAPANPLLMVHRALRGRYPLVIICAVITGLIGAAAGWLATKPTYSSQGWIRAFPRQPRVLYETEENQMLPMFEAFVRSQSDLLRSRRVVDLALSESSLREAGWPPPPAGAQKMIESLEVTAQRGSELISVAISDENPQLAQVAANAVLTAFMKYQEEQDGLSATDRERRLRENQQLLNSELKTVRDAIIRSADQFGGGDPEMLVAAKTEQLTKLDALLSDPALAGAASEAPASSPDAQTPAPRDPETLTVEDFARADPVLAALLDEKETVTIDLENKSRRFGAKHPEMRIMRDRLTSVDKRIETRVEELRSALDEQKDNPLAAVASADPAANFRRYQALRQQTSTEVRELARVAMEVKSLRDREAEIEKRLSETNKALEVIRVEDEIIRGGRVRIQQRAATPLQPTKDRRIPLAAGGLIGGAGIVVAGFVLASLLRQKLRYADELQSVDQMLPLIGVIPEARSGDPQEAKSITLALHHIRNSLLLFRRRKQTGGVVYLVTSAVQGEGKTTLGIALGASFAQAGYRTCLADFDFIGRGMTRELSLHQKQGVSETLGKPVASGSLHPTKFEGLTALPTGQHYEEHAMHLSLEDVEPVVEDLRSRYEIIIIDSGPVLGSLEAGLVAQIADAVVLVAARGTSSRIVNAALDRARSICTAGVALVFNRADQQDTTTSASYSSVQSKPDQDPAQTKTKPSDRGRLVRILTPKHDDGPSNGFIM